MAVNYQPENLDGTPQHLNSTRAPSGAALLVASPVPPTPQAPFQLSGS